MLNIRSRTLTTNIASSKISPYPMRKQKLPLITPTLISFTYASYSSRYAGVDLERKFLGGAKI